MIFILIYVDDILLIGACLTDVQKFIQDLHHVFALKTLGAVNYFLSFEVMHTPYAIHLCQSKYASDLLLHANMSQSKPSDTPMCLSSKLFFNDSPLFYQPSLYRNILGALQYLNSQGLISAMQSTS